MSIIVTKSMNGTKLTFIITMLVALSFGCSEPYSPSLKSVRQVQESDFTAISLPVPESVNLNTPGVISLKFCDSLLLATASGDKILHIYDRSTWKNSGSFISKGNGPSELLYSPFCSAFCLDRENGGTVIRFADFMTKKILRIDLTQTLRQKDLVLEQIGKTVDGQQVLTSVIIDDNDYFAKRLSAKSDSQERFYMKDGQDFISEDMVRLNSFRLNAPDRGFNFNLFSAILGYSRDRDLIVEAMTLLNQIHVYPLSGQSEGFTIANGKLRDIHYLERNPLASTNGYCALSVHKNFFSALYQKDRKNNQLQFFSWDGNPLWSINLDAGISSYDIDPENGILITLNSEDETVNSYYIPEIRIP